MENSPAGDPASPVGLKSVNSFGGLDAAFSVLLFIGINSQWGLAWAILASTTWSLVATYRRRRSGLPIGWYLPGVTVYLIIRGLVGIAFDSEAMYFGIGIATKALIGVGLAISVVAGRPIVGELIPFVIPFPENVKRHPIYASTMAKLTVVAAGYELATAAFDVWLYNNASLNGFLIVRLLSGWLSAFVTISACLVYANRSLSRIESFDGLVAMFEQQDEDPEPTTPSEEPT
jgi:hypothetical protein